MHTGTRGYAESCPPRRRGGQLGDTPSLVSDTTRPAHSGTESGFRFLGRCWAVSLKGYMYQEMWARPDARMWKSARLGIVRCAGRYQRSAKRHQTNPPPCNVTRSRSRNTRQRLSGNWGLGMICQPPATSVHGCCVLRHRVL